MCVRLLSFDWGGLHVLKPEFFLCPGFLLICPLFNYCSLCVLCLLIRAGPGEVGKDREWVHQSKQRAFHTVMAITGALCMCFTGMLLTLALGTSQVLSYNDGCVLLVSGYWFSLPSNLVLPLLFLHRAGKHVCCLLSNE